MNENLLNALMELIALFARVNNSRFIDNVHALVKTYLEQMAFNFDSRLHIRKLYEYFDQYSTKTIENQPLEITLEEQISLITKKIIVELNEEERTILFLSFLELVKLDKKIEAQELSFAETLASQLHIPKNDYQNSLLFILCDTYESIDAANEDFLIISGNGGNSLDELEGSWIEENRPQEKQNKLYLHKTGLAGEFVIMRFQGTTFLAGRYFGKSTYWLKNKKIQPEKFFILNQFDQIKTNNSLLFNFQEINLSFKNNSPHASLKFIGTSISTSNKANKQGFAPFYFCEELGNVVMILCNDSKESNNIVSLLSGQSRLASGSIHLNGYNIVKEPYRVHKMIGYVPQEPLFDANISIFQNFWFSARLAFPNYQETKLRQIVNSTIQNLNLQEFCNVPIKKIKKGISLEFLKVLVNVGIELIRDPFILIMDLPLEKLSPNNTEEFCSILKSESYHGKLVMFTSISPSGCVMKKTDRLWIFDNDGYIIYRGLASNALNYFRSAENQVISQDHLCPTCGNINTEQLYQLIHARSFDNHGKYLGKRKVAPEDWYNLYKERIEKIEDRPESKKVIPSFASSIPNINLQFFSYLKREFHSLIGNPRLTIFVLTGGLALAFIIAGLLRYDWTGNFLFSKHQFLPLLFFLNSTLCFAAGIIWGLSTALEEKNRIAFDHFKNYNFFSFLNVKYLFLIIFSLIFSLIFTTITNYISGIEGMYLGFLLIYFNTVLIGGSIGLFLGYTSLTVKHSLAVMLTIFFLNILLGGYIIPYNELPKQISSNKYVPAFAEIFPARWTYEALVVQEVKDNPYQKKLYDIEQKISDLTFKTNVLLPRFQDLVFKIENKSEKATKLPFVSKILSELSTHYPDIYPFEFNGELTKKMVSSEVISELEDYLRYVQIQLYEELNHVFEKRNIIKDAMKDSLGAEEFPKYMDKYYNPSLAIFVSGKRPGKNYLDTSTEIIQLDDPVFKLPENNYGRAHFYAPQKLMNGYYYNTTYFNLFVLGLEIFLIYLSTLILRSKVVI